METKAYHVQDANGEFGHAGFIESNGSGFKFHRALKTGFVEVLLRLAGLSKGGSIERGYGAGTTVIATGEHNVTIRSDSQYGKFVFHFRIPEGRDQFVGKAKQDMAALGIPV